MVPFAGYSMPLSYGDVGAGERDLSRRVTFNSRSRYLRPSGEPQSRQDASRTLRCRAYGSILVRELSFYQAQWFLTLSVSSISGPTATAFLEWLTPSSLSALQPYHSTLSVLLNDKGGIIDDTVICKHSDDKFYVVTNAGRRVEDLAWFDQKIKEWNDSDKSSSGKVSLEVLENWGLVALQGAGCFPCRK